MPEPEQNLARQQRRELSLGYRGVLEQAPAVQTQLSISDVGRTLVRRKFLILGFLMLSVGAMGLYAYLKTPVYEAVARLQIDPMRSSSLGLEDPEKSESPDVDGRLKTEVEIIRSSAVTTHVIDALKLYANPRFAGPSLVSTDGKEFAALPPSVQRQLINRFAGDLTVSVVPNTQVVEIRFRSPDPELSTEAANSIIEEYMQRNFRARVDGTAQVSQWLAKQMDEVKNSTAVSQQKLADFQRENNLLGSNESDNIVTDRLKQLNTELTQAEADRIIKEGRYRLADSGDPELIGSIVPSATLQVLRNQQADLETQYALLSAKYGSGYPKLREMQSQQAALAAAIDAERQNIKTRLTNDYDAAAKSEAMIRGDFEKQKAETYNLNNHASQYAILKHEVESGQQLYDTLQFKLKEAAVTSGLASSYVSIIDRAQLPDSPVEPRRKFYLALGVGGGLFGGILLGLIRDSFDDTVDSCEALEAATALPELGSIPAFGNATRRIQKTSTSLGTLGLGARFDPIMVKDPNSLSAEAYRSLCSVILLSAASDSLKVLVVTSPMPGEGKSTVSCNLATALAQRRRRVLLLDADLRCSSIHTQVETQTGVKKLFHGDFLPFDEGTVLASAPSVYRRYRPLPDLPNLTVVCAGNRPSNPAEILASPQMEELIAKWRKEYDHIIVDTPPVLPFADALVISGLADGVILVARSDVSLNKALLRARGVLARTGANILGFVLNAVNRREAYYDYPAQYKKATSGSIHENETDGTGAGV